jgi:hypothetical protein
MRVGQQELGRNVDISVGPRQCSTDRSLREAHIHKLLDRLLRNDWARTTEDGRDGVVELVGGELCWVFVLALHNGK